MALKVFKIPDGKGGITYQVQTPEGQWHASDEAGNILSQQEPATQSVTPISIPKGKHAAKTADAPKDDSRYGSVSIRMTRDKFDLLTKYIDWRTLYRQRCSKASFLLSCAMEVIRKDKDFKEFLNEHG